MTGRKVAVRQPADPEAGAELPASPLGRLRLLTALDALLVEGTVTGAARALDISTPAMSRMLAQLRTLFNDELLLRTGRGMTPTPLAERLRLRVRALAAEADSIMKPEAAAGGPISSAVPARPLIQHPPLALSPVEGVEGQRDLGAVSRRLAVIRQDAAPKQRLARYISMAGGGAGRPHPLKQGEAEDALGIILDGEADPIQVGALLVAMQYRGVNANELAGMVAAARRSCRPIGSAGARIADLDWPIYLSPRSHTPPWFLHAARLVAAAGHRVLLHGFAQRGDRLHDAIDRGAIPIALSMGDAADALARSRIAYMPLQAVEPQLHALIALYRLFEMRSPMNLVVQLLNPLGAPATIIGVPSRATRTLQRDTAALLGWPRLLAVASNRDVAQATPARTTPLIVLDHGEQRETTLPGRASRGRSAPVPGFTHTEYWKGLWTGAVRDETAAEAVISTTAIALLAMTPTASNYPACQDAARRLWNDRARI